MILSLIFPNLFAQLEHYLVHKDRLFFFFLLMMTEHYIRYDMTVVMISSVVQLSQLNNLMKIYRIFDSGSVLLLMALNRRKKLELEPINVLVI